MTEPVIIIDEFLTFVQNKIDVLDELSIVQICTSNFTDCEIEAGKSTLLKSLPTGSRNVVRKGEDKNKKNVKDIIKLLKENDQSLQPIFVAKDLNRLPPVTKDSIDVTRLLRDLAGMKSELQNVEVASMQSKISSDLSSLRSSIIKLDNGITRSNKTQQSDTVSETNISSNKTPRRQLINECTDKINARAPETAQSRSRSGRPTHTPSYRDIVLPTTRPQPTSSPTTNTNKVEDSFTLVSNKKRKLKRNMSGTAKGITKIQVAEMPAAVYISRLKKTTSIDDIKGHIQEMGEVCNDVLLLAQQRLTEFNSYKVIIPKSKLHTFLSSDFWPEGVRYRLFRDFIPKVVARENKLA